MFLGCLLFAFFGLTRVVFGIVDGRPRSGGETGRQALRGNRWRDRAAAGAAGFVFVAGAFHPSDVARRLVGCRRTAFSNTMSALSSFALLANATSLPWAEVPAWPMTEFVRATASEIDRGARLCAWFGVPESTGTSLVAVLAFDADNTLAVGRSAPFTGAYPALTTTHPQAHMFEREVWEQHGLKPEGHPWLKPVRRTNGNAPANGEFFRVDGPRNSRSRGRSRSRRRHRAGPFPFPMRGRRSRAPGNRARLSASRRGSGARRRSAPRDDEPDGNGGR